MNGGKIRAPGLRRRPVWLQHSRRQMAATQPAGNLDRNCRALLSHWSARQKRYTGCSKTASHPDGSQRPATLLRRVNYPHPGGQAATSPDRSVTRTLDGWSVPVVAIAIAMPLSTPGSHPFCALRSNRDVQPVHRHSDPASACRRAVTIRNRPSAVSPFLPAGRCADGAACR